MSLERARALGCSTVQIFSHNPRGWGITPLDETDVGLFGGLRRKYDISPVYVHASYLINLASGSEETRRKSEAMLREEMRRADAVGAEFLLLHIHDVEKTAASVRDVLKEGFKAGLLIESTARSSVPELARLMDGAEGLPAGVCIDTCHAFAAGYDIRTADGLDSLSREIRGLLGAGSVKLVHLNDSKGECGSGIDRHEHIGKGMIGAQALGAFINHRMFQRVPLILETPRKKESDDPQNIDTVKKLLPNFKTIVHKR